VEFVYTPIIQSQTTENGYDLRTSAISSFDDIAHKGVFLVSLGMRNKGYCSNMARTFIVDPSKVTALHHCFSAISTLP
jgi:nucleosome binding factor SPN SPT16 subunit